jgi:F420-dependent oxidoreductase-like protein
MRLGVHLGHWEGSPHDVVALAREAEANGFDSVWVSETWGSDAVVLAAAIAASTTRIGVGTAVLQIPARTPAAVGMSALTLDHLSGGRLRLGLGVSGPQVAEGWYGQPFDDPLGRTREYVKIVREVLARAEPLTSPGPHHLLPSGRGKALKANVKPLRSDVPIYLAAMGPRNVALAAEIADGWLPLFFDPAHVDAFELPALRDGFDVAPMVRVAIGEDLDACRDTVRPLIALYVGAYGPRNGNFYHDLVARFGFAREADEVQGAFLDGRRADAAAAVSDAMVDALALVGPIERVRERMDAYADAGATTLLVQTKEVATIQALAEVNV